jgi:glucose-6-phosphate isomerase
LLAWKHVRGAVGGDAEARARFTVTTDPAGGHFRGLCDARGFATLPVPPGVGGRFSVLSPVGLFTAAMGGLDAAGLLAGAAKTDERLRAAPPDRDPAPAQGPAQPRALRVQPSRATARRLVPAIVG